MPARGTATSSVPADVLINLSRDPDAFEEGIKRWTEAEANAREQQKKAAAAEQSANTALAKLEKERGAHQTQVAEHEKFVKQMDEGFEREQKKLDERKQALDLLEGGLNDRQGLLDSQETSTAAKAKELLDTARQLDARKEAAEKEDVRLAEAGKAFGERESKLEADLRDLQDRLKGFGFS